jgi:uncharacterized membrane protein
VWEFFIVNLLILYGVLFVLYFYSTIKRLGTQLENYNLQKALVVSNQTNQTNFLRLQDFMQQKFTAVGVRTFKNQINS